MESTFSSFNFMFTLVPLIIAIGFVLVLASIITTVVRNAKHSVRHFTSTINLAQSVANAMAEEDESTPRSLSGMDSVLLPQILADFPQFSERQVKDNAAEYTAKTLRERGFDLKQIHNSVFCAYDRLDPEKTITMQIAAELSENGRKRQKRYQLFCRNRDLARDAEDVRTFNCPNCGAPLAGSSGKCEYCGTFVRRPFAENWQFSDLRET